MSGFFLHPLLRFGAELDLDYDVVYIAHENSHTTNPLEMQAIRSISTCTSLISLSARRQH